ncbi:flavin reductase family protein [Ruficoccus sp. ZRK36]|uniref:flavin reductase family protein n=1 Tax=Ruficoccus sp. ZRK36 TaxID=2866311 RepID=UPI001C732FB9|nr:flavin reductase family protein [Ruficoccus sp. ZRK36]QYY34892.1 flavin reductase family protein [Ruficoccus sp. ZRK36]
MELDFDLPELAGRAYPILASLVTPRPIALVTTIDAEGRVNAAPFSFFNLLGAQPPICAFAPGDRPEGIPKDTALNIRATGQFVVNLVDEPLAEAMNLTAAALPFGQSELEHAGLTPAASTAIRAPRIAEAPAALECEEWGTLRIGKNRVVVGLIKRVHVRDEIYDAEAKRINSDKLSTIGRMASPHWYCRTGDRFEMIRP